MGRACGTVGTKTDPVSETSCFLVSRIPDDGQSPKNAVILCVTHHRQNPSETLRCIPSRLVYTCM
jgi:hypothetical protein